MGSHAKHFVFAAKGKFSLQFENKDFLKHKQANINVKSRCFGKGNTVMHTVTSKMVVSLA